MREIDSNKGGLPNPRSVANKIDIKEKKFNDYPYLILALLDIVPELRQCPDDEVVLYHHSVREVLINKKMAA